MRKLAEGNKKCTHIHHCTAVQNIKKKKKKTIVVSIMQYRDSEGKWIDVLLGEYYQQREKMREGREVDVQMCPRSRFS